MATSKGKAEGSASFPSEPGHLYHYWMVVADHSLSIRIESRASNQQWDSGELSAADLAPTGESIIDASLIECMEVFHACLSQTLEESKDQHSCDLVKLDRNVLQLQIKLRLAMLPVPNEAMYSIKLRPIQVDLVEILASRLCDRAERIEDLQTETSAIRETLSTKRSTSPRFDFSRPGEAGASLLIMLTSLLVMIATYFVEKRTRAPLEVANSNYGAASALKPISNGAAVMWAADRNGLFKCNCCDRIQMLESGIYVVHIKIPSSIDPADLTLLNDNTREPDRTIRRHSDRKKNFFRKIARKLATSSHRSISIVYTLSVEQNDVLQLKYEGRKATQKDIVLEILKLK